MASRSEDGKRSILQEIVEDDAQTVYRRAPKSFYFERIKALEKVTMPYTCMKHDFSDAQMMKVSFQQETVCGTVVSSGGLE
uniref:Dynein light chain n=1 Tax=Angiostrongylus cantonensis TaxID=6313 RepID=A0A0K0CZE0_ANGCA